MKLSIFALGLGATAATIQDGRPEIVGGTEVAVGQFTYITGVRFDSPTSKSQCGGSLIAPKYVLTAGHCLVGNDYYVAVGTHNLSGDADGERIHVIKTTAHPLWSGVDGDPYDFGILELEHASNGTLAPLYFEDDALNAPGVAAKVRGWGQTSWGGEQSDVLLEVGVKIWANDKCAENLNGIDKAMICAGGIKGEDSCRGDSGGPLTVLKNGSEVQVGVVSWGFECARANTPGVYGRLSHAKDFITPYLS
jgi:trypsin